MNTTEKKFRPGLLEIIDQVENSNLASIKGIISGIIGIIDNPDSSPTELKSLIELDPPLSAKILQVANSSYYASPRTISDIDQGIIWIGFDELQEIVLTQKYKELFQDGNYIAGFSREILWKHCLSVAFLVKIMYRREFGEKGNNAYAAGLMHDIGIIVLDQFKPTEFRQIIEKCKADENAFLETEKEVLGFTHQNIGWELATRWNFPLELVHAIGLHHTPGQAPEEHNRITKALFIADYLVFQNNLGFYETPVMNQSEFETFADELGFTAYAMDSMIASLMIELKRIDEKGSIRS